MPFETARQVARRLLLCTDYSYTGCKITDTGEGLFFEALT